jgi:iron(III) transport system substrate-binding protein
MTFKALLAGAVGAVLLATSALAQGVSGTLTVYTSQPSEQMEEVVREFNKKHPGVKVEVFRSGTTEVMNKLQAEFAAGSPQADVLLVADAVAVTQLKNEGRLFAYTDAPVARIPAALVDSDKTFFGTKLITTGIIYNTNLVKTAPASWNDLLVKDVAKSTIMPSPLYSGAAAIHVGTMVQKPDFGWKYYETLAGGGAIAGKGNGSVVDAVAKGEKAYGIIIEYMALNAKTKGSPVNFVFPKEGVSVITQPVAILKTAKNLPAAKAFVDWQLSEEAQIGSVAQGYFPVTTGMKPPAGYPEPASLKFIEGDATRLLKEDEATKKKFADLYGG